MNQQQPGQPGQPASEQPEKRGRGPGRPFTKNDPRLKQNIEATREAEPAQPALPPEPFEPGQQLYRDMQHVYTRPKSEDRTEGQRNCRKWMAEDIKAFMTKLADLEKLAVARGPRGEGGAGPSSEEKPLPEPHEVRARELLDRIHGELAAKDAQIAARPDAAQIGATLQATLKGALEREQMRKGQVEELRERVRQLEGGQRQKGMVPHG